MEKPNINFYDTILWRAKESTFKKLHYIQELIDNAENVNAKDQYNAWYENEMKLLHEIDKEIDKIEIGGEQVW